MKKRRKFTAEQKVGILREHLTNQVKVSELAERYDIHPNLIYQWKKALFEGAVQLFRNRGGSRSPQQQKLKRLGRKLKEKDQVIAELVEDNLYLKKNINGQDYSVFG